MSFKMQNLSCAKILEFVFFLALKLSLTVLTAIFQVTMEGCHASHQPSDTSIMKLYGVEMLVRTNLVQSMTMTREYSVSRIRVSYRNG